MKVVVSRNLTIQREELDDLKALSCDVHRSSEDRFTVSEAMAAIGGRLAAEHAWVPIAWLGESNDEAWRRQFDKMIDYARSKGWVEENGALVRAHVNWIG